MIQHHGNSDAGKRSVYQAAFAKVPVHGAVFRQHICIFLAFIQRDDIGKIFIHFIRNKDKIKMSVLNRPVEPVIIADIRGPDTECFHDILPFEHTVLMIRIDEHHRFFVIFQTDHR